MELLPPSPALLKTAKGCALSYLIVGRAFSNTTTLKQWRAFEAVDRDRLTQHQAGIKFGKTQQAISRLIKRFHEFRAR